MDDNKYKQRLIKYAKKRGWKTDDDSLFNLLCDALSFHYEALQEHRNLDRHCDVAKYAVDLKNNS